MLLSIGKASVKHPGFRPQWVKRLKSVCFAPGNPAPAYSLVSGPSTVLDGSGYLSDNLHARGERSGPGDHDVPGQQCRGVRHTNCPISGCPRRRSPTITWPAPADVPFGTWINDTQLDAVATDPGTGLPVAGTYNYTPAFGTELLATGLQTLSVTFTPNNLSAYSPVTATTTINVVPATPTIPLGGPFPTAAPHSLPRPWPLASMALLPLWAL